MNLKDSFLDYLAYERNYSPRTLRSYRDDLNFFEEFFRNLDDSLTWEHVGSGCNPSMDGAHDGAGA